MNAQVNVTMGFVLACRVCGQEHTVDVTNSFTERGTGKSLAAYWPAGAQAGDKAIGVSEGTGDTFECLPCHVLLWSQAQSTNAKTPVKGP